MLVVAALSRELKPLIKRGNPHMTFLETGEGSANAARSLRSHLKQQRARAVLGIGFAGALSSALRVGDLIIAREVRGSSSSAGSEELIGAAAQVHARGCHFGVSVTIDKIAGARDKRELAGGFGRDEMACVEMESSALALVCAENSIPFLAIRCITDELDQDFPLDFDTCRDERGNVSLALVAKAVLRRPMVLPSLLDLGRRSSLCAERLAGFVEQFGEVVFDSERGRRIV